ncbi:MAG TPA: hypothetical protein VKU41_11805 [Polyangiaceae bacterium]|nr:hypothetical protein [Polyangiaceae bacterium]
MMRLAPSRQRFRGAFAQQAGHVLPFPPDVLDRQPVGAGPSDHDEVGPPGQEIGPRAKTLTAEPLDAVSLHGAADFPGHDHAQPRRPPLELGPLLAAVGGGLLALRGDEQREVRGPDAPPLPLSLNEVCMPAYATIPAEPGPSRHDALRQRAALGFKAPRERGYFL